MDITGLEVPIKRLIDIYVIPDMHLGELRLSKLCVN